eukprot:TRINITY_DN8116_c0_g1_i1.p1 TRINITY_DN8116_c0_g1~~TRINITY_DN8116_c0_g1_i1.p1  ORF type:complete len:286 (-),score=50.69 TRINITY_DN8116_c0_g1_i1:103-960(-)
MLSIDYGSSAYWHHRYANSNPAQDAFEWYESYHSLKYIFEKYIERDDEILDVGCGNSMLPLEMYNDGYKNILNIDISEVLIKQMAAAYPMLKFEEMDVTSLAYPDSSFDAVIDKGTLDALLCGGRSKAEKMLSEISRVLKPGKAFLVVTYGPPMIRLLHLCKPEYNWSVTVQVVGQKISNLAIWNGDPDSKREERSQEKATSLNSDDGVDSTTSSSDIIDTISADKEKSGVDSASEESVKGDYELKDSSEEDSVSLADMGIWSDSALFSSDNHFVYIMIKKKVNV